MAHLWTAPEINFIIDNIRLPVNCFINEFNQKFPPRSYDSIQKQVRKVKQQQQEEFNQLSTSITQEDFNKYIEGWLLQASNNFTLKSSNYYKINSQASSLVIVLSDLHFGKKTNDFNSTIATERLNSIPQKLLDGNNLPLIDEIRIILVGDLVDGEDIYPTQNVSLEHPVIIQSQLVAETLWHLALELNNLFKVPIIFDTAFGNHGRMSKTADERSNWDNVVHMMLYTMINMNDKEIYINLNFEEFTTVQIKDQLGYINHEAVKHIETPATQVKFAGWILAKKINWMVHGHYHRWAVETFLGRPMISNGSLSGGSDKLSKRMAVEDEPARQCYFLVKAGEPINHFSFLQW